MLQNILYDCLYHSTPIILCVLGGAFAYKANVLNIGLEGMMLNGAFMSVLTYSMTRSMLLTFIVAIATTFLYGLVFSFFGVTLRGNVIVIGLAVNMASTAIAGFVLAVTGQSSIIIPDFDLNALKIQIPIIKNIPFIGPIISGHPIITYITIILIILIHHLMFNTKFGTYVRVVGENEDAAKAVGIKTSFYKYAAILLGAVGCGIAGMNLSLERLGLFTNGMTASRGFIAIAALYCGQGNPVASSLYAVLFGLSRSLAVNLSLYAGSAAGLFDAIPYVVMIVILAVTSKIKHSKVMTRGFKINE